MVREVTVTAIYSREKVLEGLDGAGLITLSTEKFEHVFQAARRKSGVFSPPLLSHLQCNRLILTARLCKSIQVFYWKKREKQAQRALGKSLKGG